MIQVWHAFQGPLQSEFHSIIEEFNHHQFSNPKGFQVFPVAYNNYTFIVQDALDKQEKGMGPQILQASEYQTPTMMAHRERILPIESLVDKERLVDIVDLVKKTFADQQGVLCSLPYNPSCGLLYVNEECLEKGGYARGYRPKSFKELKVVSQDLVQKGVVKYGWTTAWPAAYHIEVRKAQQGQPLAKPDSRFAKERSPFIYKEPLKLSYCAKSVRFQLDMLSCPLMES